MRLFLDTSVLLAACGSSSGGSREIFNRAGKNQWSLITTPYVIGDVLLNIHKLAPDGSGKWAMLQPTLTLMTNVLTIKWPTAFDKSKERPVLFSAFAWSDILLTLDRADFQIRLGGPFYSLQIHTPGRFLKQERHASRLI